MTDLIGAIRECLRSAPDTVCLQRARLVTEAYRQHERDPVPLKRARAFAHVLQHMDLDLTSNPVFAGNTSARPRAWMLIPEHGLGSDAQVDLENEDVADLLEGRIPPELSAFWATRSFGGSCGIGHLAVDLERVVHEGLEALIAEAEALGDDRDPERRTYRQAMVVALRAVVAWAHRYADAAEVAARSAPDAQVAAAHRRVAEACRHVPGRPARNLFEGLQAIALVHLAIALEGHGMSVSIGLPDRVLACFTGEGFDAAEATDLVAAFLLKIAANSVFGRASKTQAMTVGGADHTGRDRSNALTLCFLEACDRVRIGDPHLFLRWHPALDRAVKQRAVQMLAAGVSMPLLVNDIPTAQGLLEAGVAAEDAWDYCVIGCNELGIPGRSAESATATAGTIQHLELLNRTLLEHPDPNRVRGMPELLGCLEATMRRCALETRQAGEQHRRRMAESVPTPFTSALMRGCIARGRDLLVGMDYHLPGVYERGLTNAANGLAAIEEVVFAERHLTLGALVAAMRSDFADGAVRQLLRAAPKWGNDDDRADRWARELVALRERVLGEVDRRFGGRPHVACHVVRSLHHLDGRRIAASPDGRRAGTPVADSIGAETGTARAGPTGVLKSVLKLDAPRHYRGGYNLNLTLPRGTTAAPAVLSLIEGFCGAGGQELQINCVEAAALRDAQQHPEGYADLVVRVAGFSARFVDLPHVEQEELIARAEHA